MPKYKIVRIFINTGKTWYYVIMFMYGTPFTTAGHGVMDTWTGQTKLTKKVRHRDLAVRFLTTQTF